MLGADIQHYKMDMLPTPRSSQSMNLIINKHVKNLNC